MVPDGAEELLLSRHDEELPDLAVRRADRLRRLRRPGGRRRDVPRRGGARAHGGGRGQGDPRRRLRPHPGRRLLADRLQPRRRASDRDRHQADPRHGRQGTRGRKGLRRTPARTDEGARRLGRSDGAGVAALRRQHLACADRRRGTGHPHRDQERQLASLRRAGDPLRDDAPGRDPRRRRQGEAGDPPLPRGRWDDVLGPLEGAGRGLPLFRGARPDADRAEPRVGGGVARHASRAARRASRPAAGRLGLQRHRLRGRGQLQRPRTGRGDGRRGRQPGRRAQVVGQRTVAPRQRGGPRTGRVGHHPDAGRGRSGARRRGQGQRQVGPPGHRRRARRRG